jgi:predicted N-acetyltransferase YhbS
MALVLSSIFVRHSHRSQGIGKYLVQLSLDKAKTANLPLYLYSVPTAHKFYQGLGFQDTSFAEVDLKDWAPEYCGYGTFRLFGMQNSG